MMKHVKLLGLSAVAAMALMALLGVGTASATVLCKTATGGLECGEGWKYSGTIEGSLKSGTTAVLKTTGGEIDNTCTGGSAKGTASAGGATSTVTGTASTTDVNLSGCTHTVDLLEKCEGEIHSISGTSSGTVTVKGCAVTTVILGVSCTYGPGAGTDVGVVEEGGSGGEAVKVSEVAAKQAGSFLCPSTVVYEALVVRTAPEGTLGVAPS
jgi:hypothetical protein